MIKQCLRHYLLLIVLFLSENLHAETFHLLTENFPPHNMSINSAGYARNDRVSGLATDIIRKLFDNTGHNAQFTLDSDWEKSYNRALGRKGYGLYSVRRSPQRENQFLWVGPLFHEDWVLLAPTISKFRIHSLDQARRYRIGAYVFDGITDHLIEKSVDILPANSHAINAANMKNNTIDLWATSSLVGPYVAEHFRIPVKKVLTLKKNSLWLAMNIDTPPHIIAELNASLKKMHRSGEVQAILDGYLSP